ncbi:biotin--[acetyl-CoA-carboxylase] ligase [Rathayibacter toxicus]|uniref:biotin--[biotin carboxyl-carrier protein] ligase n=1 Tax=Rathayibacter toxicus TaxID=145458 RepID=A0A0C5BB10_9MICO|nr:biotin--[acetyl-CoA-carboxylase] ligase [Rathayibacter toxicus]AJM78028.1 hypothetical protein TI83_08905 [Rathayibacter toxicus]ALS57744.1 hypothetical protein APU90_08170 [Rathayibacter toxicus]KKM47325.1 hypothetical protein VT73_00280 [Rathayibacter toxicus]PPG20584.1 biotin--[acetyl-CoA-carboxylase] ligase [Rathayibacter toxicus]PPG45686.1 biotin--[acetyl-CoA-carboxylase] ligase [Rathayibacter toxicus]
MHVALPPSVSPQILWLPSVGSTNDELRERALTDPAGWPHLSVIATDDQRCGRGRLGRRWEAPAGRTLAASTLLDASCLPASALGWVSLLAGAAVARAISPRVDASVTVKWPNDVLLEGRKVAGVLAERLPDGRVVVGTGVNLLLTEDELPTPTATSLALAGASTTDAGTVLAAYLTEFSALLAPLFVHGDAEASGAADAVRALCSTLGARVRLELSGGRYEEGIAVGLDAGGRLLLKQGAVRSAFAAGDVTHLRF